jgi:hypothetical protein
VKDAVSAANTATVLVAALEPEAFVTVKVIAFEPVIV